MLENVSYAKAFPKSIGSQGPILGVGANEQEDCQGEKEQRPVLGPFRFARLTRECQQTNAENNNASPVVIVF